MAHPGGPTGGPGHNGGGNGVPGRNDGDAGGLGVGIMSPTGYMSGPRRQQTAPANAGLLTPRPAAPTGPAQSPWLMQFLQGMHGMQPQNLPGQYVPIGGPSPYGVNLPAFQSQMPQAPQAPQSMAPAGWPNLAALPQIPLGQRPPHNPNALPGGVHGVGSLLGHGFGYPRY